MNLLAIDCSSKTASAALLSGGSLLAQSFINAGLTHSETLMPMIASVLERAHVTQIDKIAVTNGPGSFTGLRIGISAALGLSLSSDIPCCGVSSLEAAAWNVRHMDMQIRAVMDARCGQVYTALFEPCGNSLKRLCPDKAVAAEEIEIYKNTVLVGDGAEMCYTMWDDKRLQLAPPHLRYPTGYGVACAALDSGDFCGGQLLRANYLRRPQAERERN